MYEIQVYRQLKPQTFESPSEEELVPFHKYFDIPFKNENIANGCAKDLRLELSKEYTVNVVDTEAEPF